MAGADEYPVDVADSGCTKKFRYVGGRHCPYGQDCVLGDVNCDGHGPDGHKWAFWTCQYLNPRIESAKPTLLEHLMAGCKDAVRQLLTELFAECQAHLNATPHEQSGGTTCTCTVILQGKDQTGAMRRFFVCAYVGDSPAFLAGSDGSFEHLTAYEHSPDNFKEWIRYLRHCAMLDIIPQKFAIQRCNEEGQLRVEYPGPGQYEQIPIWVRGDSKSGWVVNHPGLDAVMKRGMPLGGCQSVRRYVTKGPYGHITGVMPGHEHENMGNTVGGLGQNTRGFEGRVLNPDGGISFTPTIVIHELNPSLHHAVVSASDGITDLWWIDPEDLPDWVDPGQMMSNFLTAHVGQSATEIAQALLLRTRDLAVREGAPYKASLDHDDCSVSVKTIPAVLQEGED